eukprot:133773_1
MLTLLISAITLCVSGQQSNYVGPIMIREDGVNMTRYVMSTWPPPITVQGTSVTLPHNSGVQIAATKSNTYASNIFMEYKLQGKTLSYTVDISSVGCSCNAAFYMVSMPGYSSNGQPNPGHDGSYYCDANDVNNDWCWEFDIQEANKYVTAVTPHTCSQAPGGYVSNCDRGGCGTNAHNVNGNGMCPSGNCKINTAQPFRYSITFGSTYHVVLSQNGQTFEFDSCGKSDYISNMNQALNYGMVLVMSHWGSTYSTMQWLDGMTGCSGDCDTSGQAVFSDIEIS